MTSIRQLASRAEGAKKAQTALIEQHSLALTQQTSEILRMLSTTSSAVTNLESAAVIQAETHSKQAQAFDQRLSGVTTHLEVLSSKTTDVSAMLRRHAASMNRRVRTLAALMQDIKNFSSCNIIPWSSIDVC